jgi:hypothetical protein
MMLPFLSRGISFVIDNTPDPFSFTAQSGQSPNTVVYSNIVKITGVNVPVMAATTGASSQLQVSSDAAGTSVVQPWASTVTVQPGQYLRARLTTASSFAGSATASISVGLFSTTWSAYNVAVTPGSAAYTSPGSYSIVIPNYNSFTVDVRGSGGGGGGNAYVRGGGNASSGNYSYFNPATGIVIGYGGGGGTMGYGYVDDSGTLQSVLGTPGAPGSASGGDGNYTGGGAAGGLGADQGDPYFQGGNGGYGGRAVKTYYYGGGLAPGATVGIYVSPGGASGGGGGRSSKWRRWRCLRFMELRI